MKMKPNPDIIHERRNRALRYVKDEIERGDMYDRQRVVADMNDAKHPWETYEQIIDAIEHAEEDLGVV